MRKYLVFLQPMWSSSKAFRRVMIATTIYTALRLLVQVGIAVALLFPGETADDLFPDDLRIYLDAADDVKDQDDLYPPLPLEEMEFYQYAPSFATAFIPFTWVPKGVAGFIHTLLHVLIYAILYVRWWRIFERLKMSRAREMMVWLLPVWMIFAGFWADMSYLNIYILMALLATLFFEAVIAERLGLSLLWLSIILQTKPQWAVIVLIPLLLGQYRFFVRLAALSVAAYAAIAAVTIVIVGPSYGWEQHREYAHLITGIGTNYPWRTPDDPYLGYNHSIVQTAVYFFGDTSGVQRAAVIVKVVLLIPLAAVAVRLLRYPVRKRGEAVPDLSMNLFFALYTAAFIWLEVVWELSLGIVLFTYWIATLKRGMIKRWVWLVFMLYALVDFVQLWSYALIGDPVVEDGPYILTDISIYIPLIMIVTVTFYALSVARLWVMSAHVPVAEPNAAIAPGQP